MFKALIYSAVILLSAKYVQTGRCMLVFDILHVRYRFVNTRVSVTSGVFSWFFIDVYASYALCNDPLGRRAIPDRRCPPRKVAQARPSIYDSAQ